MVGQVVGMNRPVRSRIFNPEVFWTEEDGERAVEAHDVAQRGPGYGVSLTEEAQKL